MTLQGRPVADLRPGQFVGEIGFVVRRRASATAAAVFDAEGLPPRVLSWDVARLRRWMREDDELRSAMEAAVGTDLARKIAYQNVSVDRQWARTSPEQEGMPDAA